MIIPLLSMPLLRFVVSLNTLDVLTTPEEFLGENFEAVLNFWLILDDLSKEQLSVVNERYDDFYNENYSDWLKAINLAYAASEEVVGEHYIYEAECAAFAVTKSWAAYWATIEVIGGVENPIFLKMFDNL
jgi:hypothetical protein